MGGHPTGGGSGYTADYDPILAAVMLGSKLLVTFHLSLSYQMCESILSMIWLGLRGQIKAFSFLFY